MGIWKIGPALATGNAVVLKPAPTTPRSSNRLAELAGEAGLPAGLLNVVTGGNEIGEALVTDPNTAMISLTGQAVMAAAASSVKRLHLELGGKAPALVFPDADIQSMAHALTLGATYNSGQDCTTATRVYAHKDVYQDAVVAIAHTMQSAKVGDPWHPSTDIGPLITAEHRNKVHGFVTRAQEAGATIISGGEPLDQPGTYYLTRPRSSPTQNRTHRSSKVTSSARYSPSSRSMRNSTHSNSPTIPTTAWPAACGRTTLPVRCE